MIVPVGPDYGAAQLPVGKNGLVLGHGQRPDKGKKPVGKSLLEGPER